MDMKGEERIPARRDVVWAALNDAEMLRTCIPGCQTLEWTSPTTLTATMKFKVGMVSVSFTGEILISNLNPPHSYTISGEGKGGLAGFAKGGSDVVLTEDGEETILSYDAGAEVSGKIAKMGSRLIGSAIEKVARRFFADFNKAVQARSATGA